MSTPMPSRKQRQAQTRQRLLTAAARTFTAEGYHGASVSAIAAAAGYTTGAVYANFDSKEHLFLELIDEHLAIQRVEVDELLSAEDPAAFREAFRDRIEGLISGMAASGDVLEPTADGQGLTVIQLQTLTLEFLLYAVRHRPDLRQAIADRYRSVEEQLARVMTRWLELQGRQAGVAAHDLVRVQSWLTEGLGLRLLQDPDLLTAAHAADLFEAFILDFPLRAGS